MVKLPEDAENKRLILGIVVFLTVASIFLLELIFGLFAMGSAWLYGEFLNLFHYKLNFWHCTFWNFFITNASIGIMFVTKKRKNDKL